MENASLISKMPEISMWSFEFVFWAILIGIFLGLVVNMGPAFITLVQTSLHRGFRSAAWFALGVILNDAMIILICILSIFTALQEMMSSESNSAYFSIGAGIILFLFGIFTYMKKGKPREKKIDAQSSDNLMKAKNDKPAWFVFLGKGFLLNLLNPFVWIFWFSMVAMVAGNLNGTRISTLVFFGLILATTLTIEILKAWGAAKLKRFLTPRRTTLMNRGAGILLMGFGVYFIVFRGILELLNH